MRVNCPICYFKRKPTAGEHKPPFPQMLVFHFDFSVEVDTLGEYAAFLHIVIGTVQNLFDSQSTTC